MVEFKVGDLVRKIDNSYAQSIDCYESKKSIHEQGGSFEIIEILYDGLISGSTRTKVHDIIIKNLHSGRIYLHSAEMIKLVEPKIKEVTMKDLEEKYGEPIKIVK